MNEESKKKYSKVRALIDDGMGVAQALKKAKMSTNTYYKFRNEKPAKKAPRFMDVPAVPAGRKMAVIFGTPDEVISVLKGMS